MLRNTSTDVKVLIVENNLENIKSFLQKFKTALVNILTFQKNKQGILQKKTLRYTYIVVMPHIDKNSYRIKANL